jgi:hypothetical protein
MIKSKLEAKKQYSKTYVEVSYQPLTETEKKKVIEDLSSNSNKRMIVYSELFKELKTQMSYLSSSMNNSVLETENKLKSPRIAKEKNLYLNDVNKVDEESEYMNKSIDCETELKINSNKNIKKENNIALNNHMKIQGTTKSNFKNPKITKVVSLNTNNKKIFINSSSIASKVTSNHNSEKSLIKMISKSLMNYECDANDFEENVGHIHVPDSQFRSNYLKEVAMSSINNNKQSSINNFHKRSYSYNNNEPLVNNFNRISQM